MTTEHNPEQWTSTELVARIQANEIEAKNEIYRRYIRGLTAIMVRQTTSIGCNDAEDLAHDTIFTAMEQIQAGALKDPETLPGYIRTIAIRAASNARQKCVSLWSLDEIRAGSGNTGNMLSRDHWTVRDPSPDPERKAIVAEQSALMRAALRRMKPVEQEILTRFYLQDQRPKQIQAEMKLSDTQYRLLKSRAKQKLEEAGKKSLTAHLKRGGLLLVRMSDDSEHERKAA